MSRPQCPSCEGENLKVVEVLWQGEVPLDENGEFSLHESKTHDTSDEVVRCDDCGKECNLSDLL